MSALESNVEPTAVAAAEGAEPRRTSDRWLLVTGDFTLLGGMDRANYALAHYLARTGAEVHLVSHRVWNDLKVFPNVHVHLVQRPFGKHMLGAPLLAAAGGIWRRRLRRLEGGTRILVNGGNCPAGDDLNWVQYVHAAWTPIAQGGALARLKSAFTNVWWRRDERVALSRARVIITNSDKTRADLIAALHIPGDRIRTVYYGADADRFAAIEPAERIGARSELGCADDRPTVAFVGALGDRRKGFDTLYEAWRRFDAANPSERARLIVVGAGSSHAYWKDRAAVDGLSESISFLGFRNDVPRVLAACDLLVSPTRYEAYGLNVQEALCRGLPAIVSAAAGIAERYPESLKELLLADPADPAELAAKLELWKARRIEFAGLAAAFGSVLRARSWDDCSAEIVALAADRSTPQRGSC